MADYENLLDSIDAVIKSNNRREITGQILQNTLHQMVGSLGENYQLAGFATPTLDPNSPDQNVFYVTDEAGVYTNFDNITLGAGLSFLMWKNEEWTSKTLDIVTADWLDEHYVSKAFLRKVFQFFDEDGVEIFPNDTESVVDNIKAMCGLWTNEYLSALGLGEGSTIPTTLAALNDVSITYPLLDGQALVYDEQSNHWVNATIQSGVDMSVVWAALAGATNEQINISHLTTALNDYVTATSLATTLQSYVTTSALATELANYASQSWVETNYVSKAFFNSLFEAQDVNGNAITPNNSGQTTIDRLKILVGAYTKQYLSALGLSSGGGGGGSSTLAGLNDVTITNPQDGQALIYDAESSHWVNGAAISMSAVWTALAAATSEQINSSHLTSALSGYVTTSALASELANYVTISSLATTLADYVTTSALTTTLADYGSKTWIDNNYVSKAFFNRLFQAFAPLAEGQTEPTQVEPNDTTTTIDNIKAMFGLWTEQYLSALGLSSDARHSIGVLDDLNDVTITNPQTNQVLKYNGTQWVNAAAPSGASALSELTDVAISSLADKDLLQWDYATGKWKNVVLSTAMSAYALASAIPTNVSQLNNDSGFITSAALSGYATQQWVGQQGYALTSQIPTNNNQLTNGAGYITGITSSMVTGALGYTPANSSSLSNYLPLSGGTLTGELGIGITPRNALNVKWTGSDWASIIFTPLAFSAFSYSGGSGAYIGTSRTTSDYYLLNLWYGTDIADYVSWGGSCAFSVLANGYVGIGTSSPSYLAHFKKDANVWHLVLEGMNGNTLRLCGGDDGGKALISAYGPLVTPSDLILERDGGKVGIGTLYPSTTLHVNGYATASGFIKSGSSSAYVLTGDGGHAAISGLSVSYATSAGSATDSTKLPLTGGTITGILQINNNVEWTEILNASDGTYHSSMYLSHASGFGMWLGVSTSDSSHYIANIRNNTSGYGVGGSAVMYIRADGLIGIGNESPTRALSVTGSIGVTSEISINETAILKEGSQSYGNLAVVGTPKGGYYGINMGGSNSYISIMDSGIHKGIYQEGWGWVLYGYKGNYTYICLNGASDYGGNVNVVGNFVASGGVTALSDIRHKRIVENTRLQVADIAKMRAVRYIWDDGREDKGIHVGSIAQDWQQILPEVVLRANNDEGTLSLQYGVAALISSITIARKVVDHEERIKALERENADLKQAYSFIKNAYDYLKMDYENLKQKIA